MMASCRNFGVKLSVIEEGKPKDHCSQRLSAKSDKSVFSIKGTLYSVVTCICISEGKTGKRRERTGDVGTGYNKDEVKFYFIHTEQLSMRFTK